MPNRHSGSSGVIESKLSLKRDKLLKKQVGGGSANGKTKHGKGKWQYMCIPGILCDDGFG